MHHFTCWAPNFLAFGLVGSLKFFLGICKPWTPWTLSHTYILNLTFLNFLKGTNWTISLWADLPPDINLQIIKINFRYFINKIIVILLFWLKKKTTRLLNRTQNNTLLTDLPIAFFFSKWGQIRGLFSKISLHYFLIIIAQINLSLQLKLIALPPPKKKKKQTKRRTEAGGGGGGGCLFHLLRYMRDTQLIASLTVFVLKFTIFLN